MGQPRGGPGAFLTESSNRCGLDHFISTGPFYFGVERTHQIIRRFFCTVEGYQANGGHQDILFENLRRKKNAPSSLPRVHYCAPTQAALHARPLAGSKMGPVSGMGTRRGFS